MAQGFVKSANFIESDNGSRDANVLNNLGGPNIASDILLFDGNTKFTSRLIPTDYTVTSGIITVNGSTSEGRVPFSNGTLISINGGSTYPYVVKNSNAVDKFQLYTVASNTVFSPTGTLTRNDTVTAINLSNLSVTRLETDVALKTGIGIRAGSVDLFNKDTINDQVSYIGGKIGLFYYKRGRVPLTYQNSAFSLPLKFTGTVRITNDSNVSVSGSTGPGLFIIDANNPSAAPIRAFADASNPWAKVTNALQTTQLKAQANTLKLAPSPLSNVNFISTGGDATHYVAQTNTVSSYTHKLPVLVNGQEYYLLLKKV